MSSQIKYRNRLKSKMDWIFLKYRIRLTFTEFFWIAIIANISSDFPKHRSPHLFGVLLCCYTTHGCVGDWVWVRLSVCDRSFFSKSEYEWESSWVCMCTVRRWMTRRLWSPGLMPIWAHRLHRNTCEHIVWMAFDYTQYNQVNCFDASMLLRLQKIKCALNGALILNVYWRLI